jgi:NAD(P)H-nitrite reductase large subunit
VEAIDVEASFLQARLSDGSHVPCGLILLAVGVRPETSLAREAGLAIGSSGGIHVDAHMRTSDPAIWAVGDAVKVTDLVRQTPALIPLAGPANRQGRIAADNIFGRNSRYTATQGTAICKVFDLAFAMTGASEVGLVRARDSFCRDTRDVVHIHVRRHDHVLLGAGKVAALRS